MLLGSESKWSGERKKQKVIRDPLEETKRQHIAWEMSLTNLKDNNELYYWTCSNRLLASQSASHLLHIQFPPNRSIINNLIAYSPLDQVFFLKPIGELYWSDNVVTSFTSTFRMKLGGSSTQVQEDFKEKAFLASSWATRLASLLQCSMDILSNPFHRVMQSS